MSGDAKVRWGWLKFMYVYTIAGAGGLGAGIIAAPEVMKSTLGFPCQDPVIFGITGSVYLAFGLLSILGLRSPLRFAPVLLLQLCYKSIWFVGVILLLLVARQFPTYAILPAAIFASYIIGDLIAIPFAQVLAPQPAAGPRARPGEA